MIETNEVFVLNSVSCSFLGKNLKQCRIFLEWSRLFRNAGDASIENSTAQLHLEQGTLCNERVQKHKFLETVHKIIGAVMFCWLIGCF